MGLTQLLFEVGVDESGEHRSIAVLEACTEEVEVPLAVASARVDGVRAVGEGAKHLARGISSA